MTDFSLADLRLFLTAGQTGSFGRAATASGLAQPSVSARIRGLERSVGAELFRRSRRGVRFTRAGEQFAVVAERMLELAERGRIAIQEDVADETFTLGVHGTYAPTFVPSVLDCLGESTVLHVRDAHSDELIQLLDRREVDLAIVVPVPTPATVRVQPLLRDEVVCIARSGHGVWAAQPLDVTVFATAPVTVHAWGDTARVFVDALAEAGVRSSSVRWVSTASTVVALVRDRDHIGIVPQSAVAGEIERGDVGVLHIDGFPRWQAPLMLAFRDDRHREPTIAHVRRELLRPTV
jgi:DNA-binding transcriptional LysR family regulator